MTSTNIITVNEFREEECFVHNYDKRDNHLKVITMATADLIPFSSLRVA